MPEEPEQDEKGQKECLMDINGSTDMAPSVGTTEKTPRRFDTILKSVPIGVLVLYATGYFIRLAYFRSVNINCIDFFRAECFETGASFYVLSSALLASVLLPCVVILGKIKGHSLIPKEMTLVGFISSMGAILVIWLTYITSAIFLRPQDFGTSHKHMGQMTIVASSFIIVLILSTKLQQKCDQAVKNKRPWPITCRWVSHIADLCRVSFLVLTLLFAYKIFVKDLPEPFYVFRDEYCLGYLLFLSLFSAIAYRVFATMLSGIGFIQASSPPESQNSGEELVQRKPTPEKPIEKTLVVGLRISIFFLLLFLLLLSFTFGPFIHIPTNRGGGRQYNTVEIQFANPINASRYTFALQSDSKTKPVYLLDENSSWVYVVQIPPDTNGNPRLVFRKMAAGKTYCIKKDQIVDMVFQKE